MSKQGVKREYEPDPSRFCEFNELDRISPTKSEIIHCKILADYRVKLYTDKIYLIDGGDGSKASDYKSMITVEYLCRKHFNIRYRNPHASTGKISFVRIKR